MRRPGLTGDEACAEQPLPVDERDPQRIGRPVRSPIEQERQDDALEACGVRALTCKRSECPPAPAAPRVPVGPRTSRMGSTGFLCPVRLGQGRGGDDQSRLSRISFARDH